LVKGPSFEFRFLCRRKVFNGGGVKRTDSVASFHKH